MIRHFAYKEITESLYGPKFLITFAISAVLILSSTYSGYELYQTELDWYSTAVAQNKLTLENVGSYGNLLSEGNKTIRKPPRLSIFARGVDNVIGKAATVSSDPNIILRDSRFGLNPIFAVFGELDLAFTVTFILSLFALLFSYNTISGERELGTLKLVLSNSVGRASYIMGKAIGGIVTLLIVLIVPLILALLMLSLLFNVSLEPTEWIRFAVMVGVFCLYLTVFYMIGIFVSALTRNSLVSFLLCLFFWVLFVVIVPKTAVGVAEKLSPAPSIDEVEAQRTSLQRSYYEEFGQKLQERLTKEFNDPNGSRDDGAIEKQVTDEVKAKYDSVEKELIQEYERKQMRLLDTSESISRISPTSCVTFASSRLALTDASLREHLLRNLQTYREEYLSYADKKIRDNSDKARQGMRIAIRGNEERGYSVEVETPSHKLSLGDMPVFQQSVVPLNSSVIQIIPDLLVLGLYAIIFFALAFVAFLRYDVR